MTVKLGRAGYAPTIPHIDTWTADGDLVTISSLFAAATLEDAHVLRQQLLGLNDNPDEPVIPVLWADNPRVDGFYRVLSVQSPIGPGYVDPAPNGTKQVSLTVNLERLRGYSAPQIESILGGDVAVNDHSKTNVTSPAWHSVPSTSWGHSKMPLTAPIRREREGGEMLFVSGITYGTTVTYWLPPSNWYDGAATLRMGTAPAVQQPGLEPPVTSTVNSAVDAMVTVVGRQVPAEPNGWCITNGVLRVVYAGGYFMVQAYDPDSNSWGTARPFLFEVGDAPSGSSYVSFGGPANVGAAFLVKEITVVRNSPAEVVLRIYGSRNPDSTGAPTNLVTCDISLRRGSRVARVLVSSPTVVNMRVRDVVTGAQPPWVAVTGGLRSGANDADGNRWAMFSSKALTVDTVSGALTKASQPADTALDFGVAAEVGGSSATSPSQVAQLIDEYLAAYSETLVVAGR